MRKLVTLALVVGALAGCGVNVVHKGDGVSGDETRDVPEFSSVRSTSDVGVDVVPGDAPSVEVVCDQNLLAEVSTKVVGDELVVDTVNPDGGFVALLPKTDCRVTVTATGLNGISATGSGDVTVAGVVHADRLAVTSSGSGDILVASVDGGTVALTATGSGDIYVDDGDADELDLIGTGSGEILASPITATLVDARLSGSGGGEVTATDALTAHLSGSGDLLVFGDPDTREARATGSGDVVFEQ